MSSIKQSSLFLPKNSSQIDGKGHLESDSWRKTRLNGSNSRNDDDDDLKGNQEILEIICDVKQSKIMNPYFLDLLIDFSTQNNIQQQQQQQSKIQQQNQQQQQNSLQTTAYEWIKNKLRKEKKRNIELIGIFSRIAGKDYGDFLNSSLQNTIFASPYFLRYKQSSNKLYISDQGNSIIRSIRNISMNNNDDEWSGELKIEVGQPMQKGYSNGDRNTCKLRYPRGFDWDMNDNMYICNLSCICKVDSKTNQVSLVAGHVTDKGYKDGNNNEARFYGLSGILCYQQNHNHDQLSSILYVCDNGNAFSGNHLIRMIDITNGKTTTFAGKVKECGDVDGTLQSARFYFPYDIVKDDENDHILYISDYCNHKIKMIDMKKEMVSTFVGDKKYTSILNYPQQIQIIDSFIYVACGGFNDCIVKIDKHSKQVTKIKFNDGEQVSSGIYGITYHELDQCFYISDRYNIYKLE